MRWIRYSTAGKTAYGILEDSTIREVDGDPFKGYETTSRKHKFDDVKIEVPVIPPTFYCAGKNYVSHVIKGAKARGEEPDVPKQADIGYRAANALIAHNENVVIPADSAGPIVYEGELVVVIGKKAKHLSEADALSCVLGYTIGNDVSDRGWQKQDRTFWRCKNTDTFKPMGPWIDTDIDITKPMATTIRLNGEQTLTFDTMDMLYGVQKFISEMTRYLTLFPGDIIWMGTDGTSPALKHGDVVEIDITGLGTLRNPFVVEGK